MSKTLPLVHTSKASITGRPHELLLRPVIGILLTTSLCNGASFASLDSYTQLVESVSKQHSWTADVPNSAALNSLCRDYEGLLYLGAEHLNGSQSFGSVWVSKLMDKAAAGEISDPSTRLILNNAREKREQLIKCVGPDAVTKWESSFSPPNRNFDVNIAQTSEMTQSRMLHIQDMIVKASKLRKTIWTSDIQDARRLQGICLLYERSLQELMKKEKNPPIQHQGWVPQLLIQVKSNANSPDYAQLEFWRSKLVKFAGESAVDDYDADIPQNKRA